MIRRPVVPDNSLTKARPSASPIPPASAFRRVVWTNAALILRHLCGAQNCKRVDRRDHPYLLWGALLRLPLQPPQRPARAGSKSHRRIHDLKHGGIFALDPTLE